MSGQSILKQEGFIMKSVLTGIDLAKNVFQVCAVNQTGKVISNKKVTRAKLRQTISQLEPTTIAMESCYSAHYWGREFEQMGHKVNLIPVQHVLCGMLILSIYQHFSIDLFLIASPVK